MKTEIEKLKLEIEALKLRLQIIEQLRQMPTLPNYNNYALHYHNGSACYQNPCVWC